MQVVDVGDAGHVAQRLRQLKEVDAVWHRVHEGEVGALHDAPRSKEDENGEEEGTDWVSNVSAWLSI